MENVLYQKLDNSQYIKKVNDYYSEVNSHLQLNKKKRDSTNSYYGISPEMGLQIFQANKDGTITVNELREPIIVDGSRWIKRIEKFLSKTLLTNRLRNISNQLLKMGNNERVITYRNIISLTNITYPILKAKLSDLKANIIRDISMITSNNLVADIYSWDPETSNIELVIDITNNKSLGQVADLQNNLTRVIKDTYPTTEIIKIINKEYTSDKLSGKVLNDDFNTLQQVNNKVHQLLQGIKNILPKPNYHDLAKLVYDENLEEITIHKLLKQYLDIISGRNDQPLSDENIELITVFFKTLSKQLTFTKDGNIGDLCLVKGELGIIVSETTSSYSVKLKDKVVNSIRKVDVVVKSGIQNEIHDFLQSKNSNDIGVIELIKYISDKYPINFSTLAGEIYHSLQRLDINVTAKYVSDTFNVPLCNGNYLELSKLMSQPEVDKPILFTNNDETVLNSGIVSNLDLQSRPYLIKYNIRDYKKVKTTIMGCTQSRQISSIRKSRRPSRDDSEIPSSFLRKNDSLVFLDFQHQDTGDLASSKKFVINENHYDLMVINDIVISTDTIIISNTGGILGTVPNESITDFTQYSELTRANEFRKLLLPSNSDIPFILDGETWFSINQYIHFASISPILLDPDINTSEISKTTYDKIYREGLIIKGNVELSYLRSNYSFTIPKYWSTSLNTLYKTPGTKLWLDTVGDKIGIIFNDSLLTTYGELTLQNFMLKRAYYCKYANNDPLRRILSYTNNAKLLNKDLYHEIYQPSNVLMETRYYLVNDIDPKLYNIDQELILQRDTLLTNKIIKGIVGLIITRREIPTQYELELEYTTLLGDDVSSRDIGELKKKLPAIIQNNIAHFNEVYLDTVKLTTSGEMADEKYLLATYQLQLNNLLSKGKGGPKEDVPALEVDDEIDWSLIFSSDEIFKSFTEIQIDHLNSYVGDSNLITYDVPPDGDCLFHSIVDQLYYHNYVPLSQDKLPVYDLTTISKDLSINLVHQGVSQQAHVQAAISSRSEVTDKIRDNKDSVYLEDTGDGNVTTIENHIKYEFKHQYPHYTGGDETIFNEYLKLLGNSASGENLSSGQEHGIWGSELEIWAAAALYNVNIRVFILDSRGSINNKDGVLYTAEIARLKFPEGKVYNDGMVQGELKVGWLSLKGTSAHFVTLRNKSDCISYLVSDDGSEVKKPVEDGLILKIGEHFNVETGIFNQLAEPKVSTASIKNDTIFCYFSLPNEETAPKSLYYYGNKVGIVSGNASGIRFI